MNARHDVKIFQLCGYCLTKKYPAPWYQSSVVKASRIIPNAILKNSLF